MLLDWPLLRIPWKLSRKCGTGGDICVAAADGIAGRAVAGPGTAAGRAVAGIPGGKAVAAVCTVDGTAAAGRGPYGLAATGLFCSSDVDRGPSYHLRTRRFGASSLKRGSHEVREIYSVNAYRSQAVRCASIDTSV